MLLAGDVCVISVFLCTLLVRRLKELYILYVSESFFPRGTEQSELSPNIQIVLKGWVIESLFYKIKACSVRWLDE